MLAYINNSDNKKVNICPWCGQLSQIIWVHGHGQCSLCGTNIEECCRGEQCDYVSPQSHITGTENNK
jgi:hypothetical protein